MQATAYKLQESAPESRPTLTLIEGGAGLHDQAHFREQVQLLIPQLTVRALQLTRHPERARDLVQDAVLRALRFESSFTPGSNLRAWLGQVLYSVFVSQCRRRSRERAVLDRLGCDPATWVHPEPTLVMQDLSPGLRRCLAELPVPFAQVLLLVDVEELHYKDAAARLSVPVGTVMSRLHRARRMLRERLEAVAA